MWGHIVWAPKRRSLSLSAQVQSFIQEGLQGIHPSAASTMSDPTTAFFLSERCKLTSGILLLNALEVGESVFMMALLTNPFFGARDHPTPAFIFFMGFQALLLASSVVAAVGTCACKPRVVAANKYLFWLTAAVNFLYATLFFVQKNPHPGFVFVFAAMACIMGGMLCGRFLLLLQSHDYDDQQQLPTTQSSSLLPQKNTNTNTANTKNMNKGKNKNAKRGK